MRNQLRNNVKDNTGAPSCTSATLALATWTVARRAAWPVFASIATGIAAGPVPESGGPTLTHAASSDACQAHEEPVASDSATSPPSAATVTDAGATRYSQGGGGGGGDGGGGDGGETAAACSTR